LSPFRASPRCYSTATQASEAAFDTDSIETFDTPETLKASESPIKPTKLIYPDRLNAKHHDLRSYLAYASRVGLSPKSTTYVGTHYEYAVLDSLKRLGFHLQQTGGASDFGIDLLGEWNLPAAPLSLKVLIQCKALAKRVSPNVVRELEGMLAGAPHGWKGDGVLALLVMKMPATKGVREAMARSSVPMGSITCTPEGRILQMLWNKRAEDEGLLGVGVGLRYISGNAEDKEIQLTWKGENMDMDP
jgi:hypothetical protein